MTFFFDKDVSVVFLVHPKRLVSISQLGFQTLTVSALKCMCVLFFAVESFDSFFNRFGFSVSVSEYLSISENSLAQ